MLIKRFYNLLETIVGARSITGYSADCPTRQYNQLIKDD